MCGIAGALSVDVSVDCATLARMGEALVHRGPDDGGVWRSLDGRCGMTARRLAILDLTLAGHQPMAWPEHGLTLTFNGEIYNYLELRQELERLGHRFRGTGDTEALLAAYLCWGTDCFPRLNGMFALALCDERRGHLVLARDRFGEKPLYYAWTGREWVWASEIKALLRHPRVPRRPNPAALRRYLALALSDGWSDTFFEDIRQVPPAHFLVLRPGEAPRPCRYWALRPAAVPAARAERVERFRELLRDSVRLRLRSDVALGSSLSGGLDSSSVVGLMAHLLSEQGARAPATFSARYEDPRVDEGRYALAVIQRVGCHGHHAWLREQIDPEEVERFALQQDEPVIGTSQFAQWKVMALAREQGVTVLLDGQGADEILAGYHPAAFGHRMAGLLRRGALLPFAAELRGYVRHQGRPLRALRYLGGALLPPRWRGAARARLRGSERLVADRSHLSAPSLTTERDGLDGGQRWSPLKAALFEQLSCTSLPALLRYEDRNSMAFSREARLPFLDHRLVELAFGLPDDDLVSDGLTKRVLREAAAPWLPGLVRDRVDKVGFTTPEAAWFRGCLRPWLRGLLDGAVARGLCAAPPIEEEWQALQSGRRQRTANLWRVANLELWMRQFFD